MSLGLQVTGLERFDAVARDLRAAGGPHLREELGRAGRRLTGPARLAVVRRALTDLPAAGGANAEVAAAVQVRSQVRVARGVRVELRSGAVGIDLRKINGGALWHPLYGNRRHFYPTAVEPGFVERALADMRERASAEFLAAAAAVAARFGGGG